MQDKIIQTTDEVADMIVESVNIKDLSPELKSELFIGLLKGESYNQLSKRVDDSINAQIKSEIEELREDEIHMKSLELEDDVEREIYNELNKSSKIIIEKIKQTYKNAKDGNQNLI